jgi:hypothetical protein
MPSLLLFALDFWKYSENSRKKLNKRFTMSSLLEPFYQGLRYSLTPHLFQLRHLLYQQIGRIEGMHSPPGLLSQFFDSSFIQCIPGNIGIGAENGELSTRIFNRLTSLLDQNSTAATL